MGKARKLAAKLIERDKGKLSASDLFKIKNKIKKTGSKLNLKQLSEVAENRTDKTIDETAINKFKTQKLATKLIKKDKGALRAADLIRIQNKIKKKRGSTLKLKKIGEVASNRTDKTVNKSTIKKAKRKKKLDPLRKAVSEAESKVEIPRAEYGRDLPFKKYKPQGEKIEELSKARLALKKEKASEGPKTLKGTKKILKDFKKGRKDRKKEIKKIEEKVERPDFKEYKQAVEDIRTGKGAAKEYAYSGKFKKIGKKLGVKYGETARENRTKDRLATLRKGLKNKSLENIYSTAADDAKQRRKKGKKALELFRGDANQ